MKRAAQPMPEHLARAIQAAGGTVPSAKRPKYGAVKTNGFDSKAEADYAAQLDLRKAAANGDVLDYLTQVSIKLAEGVTYRADFLVFLRDGTWEFVEVKGFSTRDWVIKKKLLAERRPALSARLKVVGGQKARRR